MTLLEFLQKKVSEIKELHDRLLEEYKKVDTSLQAKRGEIKPYMTATATGDVISSNLTDTGFNTAIKIQQDINILSAKKNDLSYQIKTEKEKIILLGDVAMAMKNATAYKDGHMIVDINNPTIDATLPLANEPKKINPVLVIAVLVGSWYTYEYLKKQ